MHLAGMWALQLVAWSALSAASALMLLHTRTNFDNHTLISTPGLFTIGGLDWWTGLVDWTTGLIDFHLKRTFRDSILRYHLIAWA